MFPHPQCTHTHVHTHAHTHTQGVPVPPPFQVRMLDPHSRKAVQTKHWRSTVHAGFLLNSKRHSSVTALCQEYPEISNRIQHCKKEWSMNLLITAGAMLGSGVTGFQSAMISGLWAADFWGKEEQELWCWHKVRCGAYFTWQVPTTFPRPWNLSVYKAGSTGQNLLALRDLLVSQCLAMKSVLILQRVWGQSIHHWAVDTNYRGSLSPE